MNKLVTLTWLWACLSVVSGTPPLSAAPAPAVGPLVATPAAVPMLTPTSAVFSVTIADASLLPGGVNLLKTDANGRSLGTLGVMRDDGLDGDARAGDKVFSYRLVLNESTVGQAFFRASAAFRGSLLRVQSSVLAVAVRSAHTVQNDTLVLRSDSGQVTLSLPLLNSRSVANGSTTTSVTRAYVSDSGRYAGVISSVVDVAPGDVEGTARSTFDYLESGGVRWTATAPAGSVFVQADSRMLSSDGMRVLLVSAEPGGGAPTFTVYAADGTVATAVAGAFEQLYRTELSPNGRYLVVYGGLNTSQPVQDVVRVFEIGGGTWDVPVFDADPLIRTLPDGRFEVTVNNVSIVLPPTP